MIFQSADNIEDEHVQVSTCIKTGNKTPSANRACGNFFEFTEQDSKLDKTEMNVYEIDRTENV